MKNKVEHIENQYTSQENKKKQRQKMKMRVVRRRITVFAGVLLAIIVVLSILLVVQKHRNDIDAQERKAKEAQFQKQQNEEIALKEKLNNLNDKDYIEKIARDDYYLSNKGEVIFLGCQKTKIRLAQNLRKNKSKLIQNYPSIDIVKKSKQGYNKGKSNQIGRIYLTYVNRSWK